MQITGEQSSLLGMILHPADQDIIGFDIVGFFAHFEQFAHPTHNMFVIRCCLFDHPSKQDRWRQCLVMTHHHVHDAVLLFFEMEKRRTERPRRRWL
jgi:hypothetical protein